VIVLIMVWSMAKGNLMVKELRGRRSYEVLKSRIRRSGSDAEDLDSLSDAEDAHALVCSDRQQWLIPGDDQIGLGGQCCADDYIVIRIRGDARRRYRPYEHSELCVERVKKPNLLIYNDGSSGRREEMPV
jgi:hypothetical protein